MRLKTWERWWYFRGLMVGMYISKLTESYSRSEVNCRPRHRRIYASLMSNGRSLNSEMKFGCSKWPDRHPLAVAWCLWCVYYTPHHGLGFLWLNILAVFRVKIPQNVYSQRKKKRKKKSANEYENYVADLARVTVD